MQYVKAEASVINFENKDVIATSGSEWGGKGGKGGKDDKRGKGDKGGGKGGRR